VPALVLWLVELLVGIVSARAATVLHLVFLGFLGAVFGAYALKRAGLGGTTALIVGSVAIGVALAVAVWRLRPAGSFLTLLAAAPFVFLALFLFQSPTSKLVISSGTAKAAAIRTRATTPIVFLQLDEFPVIDLQQADGGIDAKRFPNFAKLAAASTWYRNATTVSASTTVAVPAILTGQKPKKGALPILRDHPHNLFTLLGRRYRLVVHESQTRLCPPSLCKRKGSNAESRLSSLYSDVRTVYLHLIAPPALEQRLPVIDESWGNFGGNSGDETFASSDSGAPPKVDLNAFFLSRVRDFNRFVASFRRPVKGRPTLYFAHILLPHAPWLYFPDGRARAVTKTNAPGRNGERWFNGQLATQAWQRHLLQVGYTDKLLGKLVARLHRVGLWDKALVIVMPDHGISFRGGDLRRRPTKSNLAELAFIPLFVKYPGQTQGRVVDSRHASTLDILPTIGDTLGVRIPWHVDGTSLLKGGAGSGIVDVHGVRESYRAALAQRQAALERQLSLFGSGDWGTRFDGTGPYRGLVGDSVSALTVEPSPPGSARVDKLGSRLLRHLPRASALVPSPVVGTLSGVQAGQPLALALNGRIAAVSVAYRNPGGGPVRFSLLAREDAFRPGRNTVRVFVPSGAPSSPVLRELRVALG
jgi:Sulfatase